MWDVWRTFTAAADSYLGALMAEILETRLIVDDEPPDESVGTRLRAISTTTGTTRTKLTQSSRC